MTHKHTKWVGLLYNCTITMSPSSKYRHEISGHIVAIAPPVTLIKHSSFDTTAQHIGHKYSQDFITSRRMQCIVGLLCSLYVCDNTGTKLHALIAKLEIMVWHRPGYIDQKNPEQKNSAHRMTR